MPVFSRLNPHSRIEIPPEVFDVTVAGKWLDDGLGEFANASLETYSTEQYRGRVVASDHDLISEETRRMSAKRHGLKS